MYIKYVYKICTYVRNITLYQFLNHFQKIEINLYCNFEFIISIPISIQFKSNKFQFKSNKFQFKSNVFFN